MLACVSAWWLYSRKFWRSSIFWVFSGSKNRSGKYFCFIVARNAKMFLRKMFVTDKTQKKMLAKISHFHYVNYWPESLSKSMRESADFIHMSFCSIRLHTRIRESSKPAATMLESSVNAVQLTLQQSRPPAHRHHQSPRTATLKNSPWEAVEESIEADGGKRSWTKLHSFQAVLVSVHPLLPLHVTPVHMVRRTQPIKWQSEVVGSSNGKN